METKNGMLGLTCLEKHPLGTPHSVEAIFEAIVGFGENSFMTTLYDRSSTCSVQHCDGRKRRNDKSFSESLVRIHADGATVKSSVQFLLEKYFKTSSIKCKTCNSKYLTRLVTITIQKLPEVLVIAIGDDGKIVAVNDKITVQDAFYTLFAGAYFGALDEHFVALLKLGNEIYEYDGLNEDGKLSVTTEKRLPYLYKQKNNQRKVRMLWYKKVLK